jgi:glutaredoxin-related protein
MPKFEILLVVETSHYHYVEADDAEGAVDKAVLLFEKGEPDENPACGWSKITSSTSNPMPTKKEETNA